MQSENTNNGDESPTEDIPDADDASRCCYAVEGLTWDPATDFLFQLYGKTNTRCESVFWRKYAKSIDEVHDRGIALLERRNSVAAARQAPPFQYVGARTGKAGEIRTIKTGRGFQFTVEHFPELGDNAHCHVTLLYNGSSKPKSSLKAGDRSEIADALVRAMEFEQYG